MAISLRIRRLMVFGDSDLVLNQVMKEWDIRSPAMTTYCVAVRKLENFFDGLELHHIPRIQNQAAENLPSWGLLGVKSHLEFIWNTYTLQLLKMILSQMQIHTCYQTRIYHSKRIFLEWL